MLHGEPAWLFGAVHSFAELARTVGPADPAGLVPATRLLVILQNSMPREVRLAAPPNEVASQSVTFSKPVAKQKQPRSLDDYRDGSSGHHGLVFSIDRPPLLAVRQRRNTTTFSPAGFYLLRYRSTY